MAGVGNVYKSEVLFVERVNPFARVADLVANRGGDVLRALIQSSRRMLLANREGGPRVTTEPSGAPRSRESKRWVYGRAGRPCRRRGSAILDLRHGRLNRRTFWCPRCQPTLEEKPR
jgi:endonuclease-8